MEFTGKRFSIERTQGGVELLVRVFRLWHIQLFFTRPRRTFCFAFRHPINGCDVLIMLALWYVMFSVYNYLPFANHKYESK